MKDFQAIPCEKARSIPDTLEVRKWFSELGQAGSSSCDEGVHIDTSERRKNVDGGLKNFLLSQNTSPLW